MRQRKIRLYACAGHEQLVLELHVCATIHDGSPERPKRTARVPKRCYSGRAFDKRTRPVYKYIIEIGKSGPEMKRKWKKIIVGVLLVVIGLPVVLIVAAFACFSVMDKTNGTIVSSGVTRRYVLYVPNTTGRSRRHW
jgi:hypothetical protein